MNDNLNIGLILQKIKDLENNSDNNKKNYQLMI